jgi:hypothetical protein
VAKLTNHRMPVPPLGANEQAKKSGRVALTRNAAARGRVCFYIRDCCNVEHILWCHKGALTCRKVEEAILAMGKKFHSRACVDGSFF